MSDVRVLVIGGLDPTGRAGLARDVRAIESERAEAAPVASALTVQTAEGVRRVEPVEPSIFHESLAAAAAGGIDAVKLGLLPGRATVETTERFLRSLGAPVVVDPVLQSRHGAPLTRDDTRGTLRTLFPRAALVTPNLAELQAFAPDTTRTPDGIERAARGLGAPAVLVKGGHANGPTITDILVDSRVRRFEGPRLDLSDDRVGRGKGCELASRIAAQLARGTPVDAAIASARTNLLARLQHEIATVVAPPAARDQAVRYARALDLVLADLGPACVPEVGMNVAWAPLGCRGPQDVYGLAGRITIAGTGFAVTGRPRPGGPHHTGRIAHAAQERSGHDVWVLNHRHDPDLVGRLGGDHVFFDRSQEPAWAASSMEWMTEAAVRRLGRLPGFISDPGAPGKEAMVRILAPSPEELLARHALLHGKVRPAAGVALHQPARQATAK